MFALKTADTEGVDIKKFETVKSLLPSDVKPLDLEDAELKRLNRFQVDLSNVVSLIKENKIEEAHALYKKACDAFFSEHGEFVYDNDKSKDAFEHVNKHFEEFAKWLLSSWEKAK